MVGYAYRAVGEPVHYILRAVVAAGRFKAALPVRAKREQGSVQRIYTGYSLDVKSEEARINRLDKIIGRLNQNLKPM